MGQCPVFFVNWQVPITVQWTRPILCGSGGVKSTQMFNAQACHHR